MILLLVGLPTRPKSPLDAKKDGESLSYSVLPLSDGPEGSHNRPQVSNRKFLRSITMFNVLLLCILKMKSHLLINGHINSDQKLCPACQLRPFSCCVCSSLQVVVP